MEFLTVANIDRLGSVTTLIVIAIAIITDKLVWHTRLKKAEDRATRWERVALDALTTGAQTGVHAAEVAAAVVSAIPDPRGDRDRKAQSEVLDP